MFRPPRSRVPAAALALLGGVLVLTACGEDSYRDSSAGQKAPTVTRGWSAVDPIAVDFPTDDPLGDGATLPTGDEPYLVNIWASWCVPCKTELPLLQSVAASGALDVVGFSRDRSAGNAEEALADADVTYPNWLDSGADLVVALDGRVPLSAVPSTVLVRDGRVVAVHVGELKSRSEVLQALEQK
ncbi:thiol-disulfide isomerase/thioredoxin [Marmoricola sp. OAE513]|uniref:TlpA family protein disulfide reductase n=1 Tax=Marmoricola sp. OAE513 TaxID=2817894 RepID=UPI001AE4E836